jgi:hypothetical protein
MTSLKNIPLRQVDANTPLPSEKDVSVAQNTTLPSPNSSSEELLASAHELLDPSELIWNLDCSLKRSLPLQYAPVANRILRLVMSYPLEQRAIFNLDDIFRMMISRKFLEPSTEKEILRLYPLTAKKYDMCPKIMNYCN